MQALIQSHGTSRVGRLGHFFCNIMDIVLFVLHIRGLKPLLVFNFRVKEKFAGGKFRGTKIPLVSSVYKRQMTSHSSSLFQAF